MSISTFQLGDRVNFSGKPLGHHTKFPGKAARKCASDTLRILPKTKKKLVEKFVVTRDEYSFFDKYKALEKTVEIENCLDEKRKNLVEFVKKTIEEWKKLETMELQFKETFIDFSGFMEKQLEKKERLLENRAQYAVSIRERNDNIKKITKLLEKTKLIEEAMYKEAIKHRIYPNFLENFVEKNPQYLSTTMVVKSYESNMEVSEQISKKFEKNMNFIENMRAGVKEFITEQVETTENYKRLINQLSSQFQEVFRKRRRNAHLVVNICEKINSKLNDNINSKYFIHDYYVKLCEIQNIEPIFQFGQYKKELWFIDKFGRYLSTNLSPDCKSRAF